jgi:predicted Zn-dependent protease
VDRAAAQLAQLDEALKADGADAAKLGARRDKQLRAKKPLDARLAEAQAAAQPAEQAVRALAAYSRAQWKQARDEAEHCILAGLDKELTYLGALARLRLGELKEAVARLDKPELAGLGETQRFLGLAKLHLGDTVAAQLHLERAHLPADDGEGHAALGEIFLRADRMQRAAEELEKAVKVSASDPRLLGLLGRAQLALGRNVEAAKTLERVAKLSPRDPEAAYLEAVARSRTGDNAAAEKALSRYLSRPKNGGGEGRYERPRLPPLLVP